MKPLARALYMYLPLCLAMLVAAAAAKQGPCTADLQKHCRDLKGLAAIKCLNEHMAALSAPCKEHLAATKKGAPSQAKAKPSACSQDAAKLCKTAKPGPELAKCLQQHEAQLSEGCKQERKAVAERRAADSVRLKACLPDIEKFCKDVKPGGGRVMACLAAHEAELSAACSGSGSSKKGAPSKKQPAAEAK